MTAQIPDVIKYRNKDYNLAGLNGFGLFDPAQQGVNVVFWSTGCWRGYHCKYQVADNDLYLIQVNVGLSKEDWEAASRGEGPKLFGKVFHRYTEYGIDWDRETGEQITTSWDSSDFMVDGLWEPVPFTGGMLLGAEFIREMYVHMGYHPAYKFQVVHELIFDSGHLLEEYDRSAQIAEYREKIASQPLEPDADAPSDEIEEWIEKCFSLQYEELW